MALSNVAGFPRIGARRELKRATEGYWTKKVSAGELTDTSAAIRRADWEFMRDAGIDLVPSNDFSYWDQVLDTVALLGAVPPRYGHPGGTVSLDTYFAMARGSQGSGVDVIAMEMLKWFDTNYHYVVPELSPSTSFSVSSEKPFEEYAEAKALGMDTVPVLIGPFSFLALSKPGERASRDFDPLSLVDRIVPVYAEVIGRLGAMGARWVQIDEPALVTDRTRTDIEAVSRIYAELSRVRPRPDITVKTYFDSAFDFETLSTLPVEGLGIDLHRGRDPWAADSRDRLEGKVLFAGIVDGRNVWINDLEASLRMLEGLAGRADGVVVSTSCSLLHVPIDLDDEPGLDPEIRSWLAFAKQKVREVALLARGLNEGTEAIADELRANRAALEARRVSPRTVNPEVRKRVAALGEEEARRNSTYAERAVLQRQRLKLPPFPTTTIGSYPQTREIRHERTRLGKGEITQEEYVEEMKKEIERVVRFQEEVGLDVLVHGEAERNDMVQYFAEMLEGYVFTRNAWVQSTGNLYVRPPIIYGDVFRTFPMTVDWITYAQSLTDRPMKGMLTGPVTMLMWSFVRDDIPRSETCKQLAVAIRDEVIDLEAAGIKVIQVDEPAIREGLPLHRSNWKEYLDWAVYCFRVAVSPVSDETQIQTHLCYSEFGDIIEAVDAMDADVALIWCAKAGMRLLDDLRRVGYEREVGPGVYDIHSPRIPSVEEMVREIAHATERLHPEQVWVNPDCGLKTRAWEEVTASVRNMVEAARQVRAKAE